MFCCGVLSALRTVRFDERLSVTDLDADEHDSDVRRSAILRHATIYHYCAVFTTAIDELRMHGLHAFQTPPETLNVGG